MIQEVIDELKVKAAVEAAVKSVDEIVVNLIRQFAEGMISEVDSSRYGLRVDYRKLQDLMSAVGFLMRDDLDLNGWENDYWESYEWTTADGSKKAVIYGTMADGSFKISWDE